MVSVTPSRGGAGAYGKLSLSWRRSPCLSGRRRPRTAGPDFTGKAPGKWRTALGRFKRMRDSRDRRGGWGAAEGAVRAPGSQATPCARRSEEEALFRPRAAQPPLLPPRRGSHRGLRLARRLASSGPNALLGTGTRGILGEMHGGPPPWAEHLFPGTTRGVACSWRKSWKAGAGPRRRAAAAETGIGAPSPEGRPWAFPRRG